MRRGSPVESTSCLEFRLLPAHSGSCISHWVIISAHSEASRWNLQCFLMRLGTEDGQNIPPSEVIGLSTICLTNTRQPLWPIIWDTICAWNHVNRFPTMKCLNWPKSETTSPYPSSWVVHHPFAQAENSNQCHLHFLWSLLLSAYYLFAQMMALAMSVIFQEGGRRSSKQTTFSNKKIWGLIWLPFH